MNNMRPIPPGEHLREEMMELALSARTLATRPGCARESRHGDTEWRPSYHGGHGASARTLLRHHT